MKLKLFWVVLCSALPILAAPHEAYLDTVTSDGRHNVTVVDWQTRQKIALIQPNAPPPRSIYGLPNTILANPNGQFVYFARGYDGPAGEQFSIDVISTATKAIIRTIPVPGYLPAQMAVSPDGKTLWVMDFFGPINIICLSSYQVIGTVSAFPVFTTSGGGRIVFSPDGKRIYQTLAVDKGNFFAVIDASTRKVLSTIQTSTFIRLAAISPDGAILYAVRQRPGALFYLSVISTTTLEEVAQVDFVESFIDGVTVSPDGKTVYAAIESAAIPGNPEESLAVIDAKTNLHENLYPLGTLQGGPIRVTPDGKSIWAFNYLQPVKCNVYSEVLILSTTDYTVTGRIGHINGYNVLDFDFLK